MKWISRLLDVLGFPLVELTIVLAAIIFIAALLAWTQMASTREFMREGLPIEMYPRP